MFARCTLKLALNHSITRPVFLRLPANMLVVILGKMGQSNKRAASRFYAPKLFSDRTRHLDHLLARLG